MISSFTATPDSAEVGGTVTLSWETAHAEAIALADAQGQPIDLAGAPVQAGSVTVAPDTEGTHIYTLTATGAEGTDPATAQVTVAVQAVVEAPVVGGFTCSPSEIAAGETSTLSWTTEGAESLQISDGQTAVLDTTDAVATGTHTVTPDQDTTYTLTVQGPGGEASATCAVTVRHPPVVDRFEVTDLSGSPVLGALMPGQTVRLVWETTDADAVSLTDGTGDLLTATEVDGSLEVTPPTNDTYTLRATGPDGETTATLSVEVLATVESFTIAAAGQPAGDTVTVRTGEEVTVAWQTQGALEVLVTAPDGFSYTVPPEARATGTVSFTATAEGPVRLSLSPAGFASEAEVTLTLTEAPRVREVTVAPSPVTAGSPLAVSWVADGANQVVIEATDGAEGLVTALEDVTPEAGTREIVLPTAGAWTVTVTAHNHTAETHAVTTPVTVVAAARILAFHARPGRVVAGDATTVSWETSDAATVRLLTTVGGVTTSEDVAGSGSVDRTIAQDTTYQLEALNALGYSTLGEAVTVQVGQPEVLSFTADGSFFHPGDAVTFSWETLGGRTLEVQELSDPTVTHCTIADAAEIESGTCSVTAPATLGTHSFQLRLTDGALETLQTAQVEVVDGPVIRDFRVSSQVVTEGSAVTFAMTVDSDVGGVTPTLTITQTGDGLSAPVVLPAPDYDPEAGIYEVSLSLDDPGLFTFTLEAATDGTVGSTDSLDIRVVPAPAIVAFETSADQLDRDAGELSAMLSWTTTTVARVELYADDVLLTTVTDPALVAEGTYEVSPEFTTRYRLHAFNAAGTKIEASLLVEVDLPYIDSFVATGPQHSSADHSGHLDILEGEQAVLSWTTRRVEDVGLSEGMTVAEEATAFVDRSTSPTATVLFQHAAGDSVEKDLTFDVTVPGDYAPLYFGRRAPSFTIHTDGRIELAGGAVYPFGRGLKSKEGASLVWATGTDLNGRYTVVQWKGWDFDGSGRWGNPSSISGTVEFQAYLYANGDVRFAYGAMTSGNYAVGAAGDLASVGLRDPWHSGSSLTLNLIPEASGWDPDVMPGGLQNRSWRIDFPTLAPNGSFTLTPTAVDTQVHLVGSSRNGEVEAELEIETWPDMAQVAPYKFWFKEPAQVGDSIMAYLRVDGANQATLRVGEEVICNVSGSRSVASYCAWEAPAAGTYTVILDYSNPVSSNSVSYDLQVHPRMEIESFTVNGGSETTLNGPGEVTLAWETSEAVALALVDDAMQPVIPSDQLTGSGTAVVHLDHTTSLRLYAADSPAFDGRVRTALVNVYVNETYVRDFSTSPTQVPEGGEVTLAWDGTSRMPEARYRLHPPPHWMESGVTYTSIAGDPATRSIPVAVDGYHTLDLSGLGFSVPFDGRDFDVFQVFTNGFIGFGDVGGEPLDDLAGASNTYEIPYSPYSDNASGYLAAYWDDLYPQAEDEFGNTSSQLLWRLSGRPGERTLVVEWVDWRPGTYSSYAGSLNFQGVIHEDGTMEIRFGPMVPAATASTTGAKYYAGNGASIGWEDLEDEEGVEVLTNEYRPDLVADGIVHHFPATDVPEAGSVTLPVASDSTFTFCVETAGYQACQDQTVNVVHPGDVLITELMVQPGTATAEYVELRNVGPDTVDISGWVLTDADGATFTLPALPALAPGDYRVFAASLDPALNGGVNADATWEGTGFDLSDAADTVILGYQGLTIDSVQWDTAADWTLTPGASWSLAPTQFLPGGPEANDLAADWCTSGANDTYGAAPLNGSPGLTGYGCDARPYDLEPWAPDAFIDIAQTENRLIAAEGDDVLYQVPTGLGFAMPYWDQTWQDLWISSNGWVWLGPGTWSDALKYDRALPTTTASHSPGGIIAPFWEDLNTSTNEANRSATFLKVLQTPAGKVAIVQWQDLRYDWSTADGAVNFQVQLHESGDIVFAYGRLVSYGDSYADNFLGGSATVGIEKPDESDALVFSYHQPVLREGRAVLFRRRP